MLRDEDCRTAVLGKTERTVGWEGNGEPIMTGLVRHCIGKPAETDRPSLTSLNHSFTLDVLVLTPTRWTLRRAVRLVNETLAALGLAKAPNKTFIGRIAKGFSWLGYHLGAGRLRLARATWERCAARIGRLYEQHAARERMGTYVQHWLRWVQAGLGTQVDWGGSINDNGQPTPHGFLAPLGTLGVGLSVASGYLSGCTIPDLPPLPFCAVVVAVPSSLLFITRRGPRRP
jgi:hypothetical protein